MTAHPRYRRLVALAAGALVAPLALVATTTAPADAAPQKHKHEVYIYKVEKNLKLAGVGTDTMGDTTTPFLQCNGGDIVLDGMWMVKSVDPYHAPNPDPDEDPDFPSTNTNGGKYNDLRDVYVLASWPDADPRRWNFEFENRAYGDAQVKIYATCVRGFTEKSGAPNHNHQILVRPLTTRTTDFTHWTGHPTLGPNRSYYSWGAGASTVDPTGCGAGEYFVAPGFKMTASMPQKYHRLVASYPAVNPGAPGRGWTWEFGESVPLSVSPTNLPNINLYGKCISRKVGANPHTHALAMKHMPSADVSTGTGVNIPVGDPRFVEYSCDQDEPDFFGYKAAVGFFWVGHNWHHNWFLGMEPRPKTRVFGFWNAGAVSVETRFGALCINSRTANPIL
ncbi:hypothetical protein [Nocardioides caricicola]|uniref:Secreted protein n=1 Tax=Nocardioides caricicola TaxID=634770 RepID=A0ABW0MXP5_9ACTN